MYGTYELIIYYFLNKLLFIPIEGFYKITGMTETNSQEI